MKKHTNRLIALLVLLALLLGSFCSAELSLDEGGSNEIPAASQSTEPASTIGAGDDSKLITSPDSTPDPNASIDPAASFSTAASVEPSASVDPETSVDPSASVDPEASVEPSSSSSPEASVDPYAIMLLEGDDEEDLDGTTSPVDSSTTLADGSYTPEDFSFSGGSGKTTISCTKLTVSGGKATATIAFSSSSYTYVKASGSKFDASVVDGKSSFDIPVDLNADNSIIGCTTAMGTPKEIEYSIHVTLAEPEAPSTDPDDLVDYEDGDYTIGIESTFSMFKIVSTRATVSSGKVLVTISTAKPTYDRIHLGSKNDEASYPDYIQGASNDQGGYDFSFSLPASYMGTSIDFVPGKPDGSWYSKNQYQLTIPAVLEMPAEPDPIEDGEYNTPVESSSSMFKVVACVLTTKDGKYTATVTLSGTGYDKLYLGTAADAATADESALIPFVPDAEGKYTYSFPVEALDTPIAIAAHSSSKDSWYDRTLTFLSEGMEKIQAEPDPIEDGEYNTPVESSSSMFKVVACVLTAKDGKYTATVTLSGTGYDKLYLGTAADAATADESALIPFVPDAEGKYSYSFPVEALDTPIAIAAHSSSKDSWYDRTLTFLSEGMEKIGSGESGATPAPSPSESAEPTSTPEADLSGSTSRVDSSTSLPDGVYTPDKFSFSGGTGKVSISCTKVTVSGGKATATLVFSSPNYSYVKANGNKYYGSHSGSSSTFQIPVKLNANNRIIGMTTAMSQDHEVEYTIYIYLAAADEAAGAAAAAGAPEIAGLRFESADEIEHATLFTIFRYEGGFIVIDVVDVGSFLLVPEGAEVPTGAAEDATLIQLPVQSAYVASESAMALIDGIEIPAEADPVTLTGCEGLALRRMALLADGGQLSFAGAWSAPDYTTLLMSGCDLAILPDPFSDAETVDEADRAIAAEVADRLGLLGVPAFVDRSAAEETELGRLEWIRVYGAIFGCEDAASAAYADAVAELNA